jgi:glycosyltransferase involved in cell wall biosynthesis
MHILFLSDNFPPEVNAPATRTFEHCREWVRAGHRVTVITCAPNFPQGRIYAGYRNRLWQWERIDGIDVLRVWTYITSNSGFLKRTIDYASFLATAAPASLFVRRVDLIVATSPQLFAPCAAWVAGLIKRRPYVFELRDLWPESIKAVGAMRNARILGALERLELFLYRKSAGVVAVTNSFRHNLIDRGIAPDKISVVMNGADLSRFKPQPRNRELSRQLGLDDKIVAGYVGTHGMAHGLATLLEAAKLLAETRGCENIRILLLGDGAEKAALQQRAKQMQLANVIFVASVPRSDVADYWSLLDVAIIHLKKTPLFETVIPSKLFECMAMGLPVLHGVAGESAAIVEKEGCGLTFPPEDAAALAGYIQRLASDPGERAAMAERARLASARYDRSAQAAAMLTILETVARRGGSP